MSGRSTCAASSSAARACGPRCGIRGGRHFKRYTKRRGTWRRSHAARGTVIRDARTLCRALGYDMNTVEFAISDGVPYAIDFMNSAPDFDFSSLGRGALRWAVEKMADLVIRLAGEKASRSTLESAAGAVVSAGHEAVQFDLNLAKYAAAKVAGKRLRAVRARLLPLAAGRPPSRSCAARTGSR